MNWYKVLHKYYRITKSVSVLIQQEKQKYKGNALMTSKKQAAQITQCKFED